MEDEGEIVVSGKLNTLNLNTFIRDAYANSGSSGGGPSDGGGGGGSGPGTGSPPGNNTPPENLVITIPGLTLKITISSAEWENLTANQQFAVLQILSNYSDSPTLKNAFEHYESEQVAGVQVHVGPTGVLYDGTPYNFQPGEMMVTSSHSFNPTTGGDDLVPGSTISISINTEHWNINDMKAFSNAFIHELLHPFVPDMFNPVTGIMDDHPAIVGVPGSPGLAAGALNDVFGDFNWSTNFPAPPAGPGYGGEGDNPPGNPSGPPYHHEEPIGGRSAYGESFTFDEIGDDEGTTAWFNAAITLPDQTFDNPSNLASVGWSSNISPAEQYAAEQGGGHMHAGEQDWYIINLDHLQLQHNIGDSLFIL